MTPRDRIQAALREVKEREEKATKGPWSFGHGNDVDDFPVPPRRRHFKLYSLHDGADVAFVDLRHPFTVDFVTHARTDIPRLLKAVEKLTMAQAALCSEAWFVLKGGDDPHDACTGCGLAGIGDLRMRLKEMEEVEAEVADILEGRE